MADKESERAVDSVTDYVEDKEVGDEEKVKASLSELKQAAPVLAPTR